jgi:hypothetical protein
MRLTNTTRDQTLDFVVKGEAKDGVPPTESLAPGETRNLAVDPESAAIKGALVAGVITVESGKAAAKSEAQP